MIVCHKGVAFQTNIKQWCLSVADQVNFSMELFSSSDRRNNKIPLICRVMGVMSSEVRIVWIVNGAIHAGSTESVWTKENFTKILQSRFWMQVSEWQPGAQCTCLVEARGVNISESLKCECLCRNTSMNLNEIAEVLDTLSIHIYHRRCHRSKI